MVGFVGRFEGGGGRIKKKPEVFLKSGMTKKVGTRISSNLVGG